MNTGEKEFWTACWIIGIVLVFLFLAGLIALTAK